MKIIDEITRLVGHQVALQLLRRYGGRRLRIPKHMEQDHPMVINLGYGPAQVLVDHFGGEELELPAEANALLDTRNAGVFRAYLDKRPIIQIAQEWGISRRHVRRIVEKKMAQADIRPPEKTTEKG